MELAFFSFVTLHGATPQDHSAYNRWHQLDHRPENLALPGVAWGDRWSRTPADKQAEPNADDVHANTDYIAMYWFRPPVERSVASWDHLGERSFQWGRGPLIPGVSRTLLGFFRPVKGYVATSALVSPEVLPYRPNRGLHVSLTRHRDHHGAATHARHTWEDQTLIPNLLNVDGVAGVWTFSFSHYQQHSTLPMGGRSDDTPGSLRIRLVYLDGEPLATCERLRDVEEVLAREGSGDPAADSTERLLTTPVRTIIPWQDW